MNDDIFFEISFRKADNETLTADDHAEIVERALLMLSGVLFFGTSYTYDHFENNHESLYDLHLDSIRIISRELISIIQEHAEKVNIRRKEIEKIVSTP